jgi:hypothetical protein
MAKTTKKTARKSASKKAAKKTAKKATTTRNEMTHIVEPKEGSVREHCLKLYRQAKGDVRKAKELAAKAKINPLTAQKQLYLIHKVGGKNWSEDGRATA